MNTPYRDAPAAQQDDSVPDFGGDRQWWPGLLLHSVLVLTAALVVALYDMTQAITMVVLCGPSIVIATVIAVLERPVGNWLAARRARAVVAGVIALEAKANAKDAARSHTP